MDELILTGFVQSLILAFVAFGVMIPFRILNFADLTPDGSYPFGAAVGASALLLGAHPLVALVVSAVAAGCVGIGTAWLYLRFRIHALLAGIVLSAMVYSVNLRLLGKPNRALFESVMLLSSTNHLQNIGTLLILFGGMSLLLWFFLRMEKGLQLRAVGLNVEFAQRQGISIRRFTILGLFLGNLYAGLAGGLMVQLQHYVDVGMGVGMVIHALAALMIGESLLGSQTLPRQLLAPLIGALVYQQIQGLVLLFGLAPSDLKLLTGGLVLAVMAWRNRVNKLV